MDFGSRQSDSSRIYNINGALYFTLSDDAGQQIGQDLAGDGWWGFHARESRIKQAKNNRTEAKVVRMSTKSKRNCTGFIAKKHIQGKKHARTHRFKKAHRHTHLTATDNITATHHKITQEVSCSAARTNSHQYRNPVTKARRLLHMDG